MFRAGVCDPEVRGPLLAFLDYCVCILKDMATDAWAHFSVDDVCVAHA